MGAFALPLAIGSAVAGGAASAAGDIMESRERAKAQMFESQQLQTQSADYARQEQEFRTAAAQTEARRREELTSSLETVAAIRAGRGVGASSPTALAILDNTTRDEERDIRTERLNYLTRAETAKIASKNSKTASGMAKRSAKSSLIGGVIGAVGSVANTVGAVRNARQT